MDKKVLLQSFNDEFEANVMLLKLQEANIPCWVINKKDSTHMVVHGMVELYVDAENVKAAEDILSE